MAITKRTKQEIAAAAALLLLKKRAIRSLSATLTIPAAHLIPLGADMVHVQRAIGLTQQKAIETVREKSRSSSSAFWSKWTGATAIGLVLATRYEDEARARRSADAIAQAWRKSLLEQETHDLATAAKAANAAAIAHVERTATTEVYDAWNDETGRQNRFAYANGSIVVETWSAMLDACPACSALDGTRVVYPDSFTSRPPLHPRCHCDLVSSVEPS